ncbi:MAG: DUF1552 domain-containing protein, partial [Planctomycetota bacterium]|nr:DUF1552 domain-containing protein [Planctomycetota bacterium]
VVQPNFWPDEEGDAFTLKESTSPLEPFKDRTLFLKGISNRVRGAGSGHMRGIGCLLTGVELNRGNQLGGSGPPAGWAGGISIDQEIKSHLLADPATRTRFGSLEFGVMVPDRADTWTRLAYAGPNKPVAPINDPYQMFAKLYGHTRDREQLASVLDEVREDLRKLSGIVSVEDRHLLEEHATFVREMESELSASHDERALAAPPDIEFGIPEADIPRLSRTQIDLMVAGFAADFARVATLQYSSATSQATMPWLGIDEKHHELSHEPDKNEAAQEKLTRINTWYCEQIAYLAKRLAETPEPGGEGSLLDNTTVVWTNELGKGNSHTMHDIPFVLIGEGLGFQMGRSLNFDRVPHNRLLLSLAHAFGHHIATFGHPDFCGDGPLAQLT